MSVDKKELKKELDNLLNEAGITELPEYAKQYEWTHHSPSQIQKPDDNWGYMYLYLSAKDRANMPGSAKMEAGAIIGQAMAEIFADKIYDRNKKKFFKNEKKKEE